MYLQNVSLFPNNCETTSSIFALSHLSNRNAFAVFLAVQSSNNRILADFGRWNDPRTRRR